MPRQTLERLSQLGNKVQALRGNGDREVVTAFDDLPLALKVPEAIREETCWVAQQIEQFQRDYLAHLPGQITLSLEDSVNVLFCHANRVAMRRYLLLLLLRRG